DAAATLVLTRSGAADRLPAGVDALRLDTLGEEFAKQSPDHPPRQAAAGDPFIVLFTSGSTGEPKGVELRHDSIVRLVADRANRLVHADDTVAQIATLTFDAATFEIFAALLNGAKLVIVPRPAVLDSAAFAEQIRHRGITATLITTALFHQHIRTDPELFRPLRLVLFGGEAVDPALVRRLRRSGFAGRLLNLYGPTEATVYVTSHEVGNLADDEAVPIG